MKKFALLVMPLMAISFLANCGGNKPKEYTVTFNPNGGNWADGSTTSKTEKVKENEFATEIESPIKIHTLEHEYKFDGWQLNGEAFNFKTTPINSDIELKAKWLETGRTHYDVIVNNIDDYGTVEGCGSYELGSTVTLKAIAKQDYYFVGWKEGTQIKEESATYQFKITKDITLTTLYNSSSLKPYTCYLEEEENKIHINKYKGSETKNIVLPSKALFENKIAEVGYIRAEAFMDSDIESIETSNSTISMGVEAFKNCVQLKSIKLGKNLVFIADKSFIGCSSLESIIVDKDNEAYESKNNSNAIVAKKDIINGQGRVVNKKNSLVLGCKNTTIPDDGSVTSIGEYAFSDCSSLDSITLPESVTSIDEGAFQGCGFSGISMPTNTASIGALAFNKCSELNSVDLTSVDKVPACGTDVFNDCDNLTEIIVKKDLIDQYKTASGWSQYSNIIIGA